MPKIKTKKSVSKRFRVTKNGKVIRTKAFSNHILTKKSKGRKRKYRKPGLVSSADIKSIKSMLPYS